MKSDRQQTFGWARLWTSSLLCTAAAVPIAAHAQSNGASTGVPLNPDGPVSFASITQQISRAAFQANGNRQRPRQTGEELDAGQSLAAAHLEAPAVAYAAPEHVMDPASPLSSAAATPPDAVSNPQAVAPAGAPPSSATSPPAADNNTVSDIVVTAQRRSENLQDVPIAITAATAAMLQARGVSSTRDLIAAIPSLTILATAGYLQPRIRGIGNTALGAGFEGGVAIYVDGVYQASAQANLFSLQNIDRVEVLKGPQGTLFGRNTTGGLIQIITREPSENFGGTVALTAANYKDFTGDLYLTGGLARNLAMNFTAHVESQGRGWGTNLATGGDSYRVYHDVSLRSSLLFRPAAGTEIRVNGDYEDDRNNISSSIKLAPGTGFRFPLHPILNTWDTSSDIQPYSQLTGGGIDGHVRQDLGFASLVSITAFRKSRYQSSFDGDGTSIPLVNPINILRDQQFSQEVQLASKVSSRIKWLVGGFYFNATSKYDPSEGLLLGVQRPNSPLGPVTGSITYASLGTRSLSAYGQATAPIGGTTNLTLGFRYTSERKGIGDISTYTVFALLPSPVAGVPVAGRSVQYSRPTWRVSLDHRFSPELLIYASYNRGFKSGGFNGQFPTDNPFLPESIDAYEFGAKTDLLGRRLRIDAAAFYYDYTNIQVSKFIGQQTSYYNGAAARVYGIDADFEARLTQNLSLSGGLTLLHDRFTSFPNAVISTQVLTGIVITTGSAEGNRLPATPDFSSTVTGNYHVPLGFAQLALDASYTYNAGYFTQPDNILRQPAYNLVSVGAGLNFHNGLSARAWVRNLLDTKVYNTLQAGSFDSVVSYQAPRTYGITVTAKF